MHTNNRASRAQAISGTHHVAHQSCMQPCESGRGTNAHTPSTHIPGNQLSTSRQTFVFVRRQLQAAARFTNTKWHQLQARDHNLSHIGAQHKTRSSCRFSCLLSVCTMHEDPGPMLLHSSKNRQPHSVDTRLVTSLASTQSFHSNAGLSSQMAGAAPYIAIPAIV